MKLVRFELLDSPGEIRSGLVYGERVYETDGDQAKGIHEFGQVRLFAPIGAVPSLRIFELTRGDDGAEFARYSYGNPRNIQGPLAEIPVLADSEGLDLDLHVAAVVQDSGTQVLPDEAARFVLGYTIYARFYIPSVVQAELSAGLTPIEGYDVGGAIGPFLVTPEDVAEYALSSERLAFAFPYELKVNQDLVAKGVWEALPGLDHLLAACTRIGTVNAADLIAWPRIPIPPLEETELGRPLLPSDRVSITIEGIGTLVVRLG